MVGATTLDEYRKHIEQDAPLERRFQPVTVGAPSVVDTVAEILTGLERKSAKCIKAVLDHRHSRRGPLRARPLRHLRLHGRLRITAAYQAMGHPVCDFAQHVMKVSLAGTGVRSPTAPPT